MKYKIMVLACQVGPFHLTLTQINWEMNCIAKSKCTDESQKLDLRGRGENLNATSPSRVRATTCIFFAFFVFYIFYVMQVKHQNATGRGFTLKLIRFHCYMATTNAQNNHYCWITFSSRVHQEQQHCVIIVTLWPISDSHQDLMRFKNNKRT